MTNNSPSFLRLFSRSGYRSIMRQDDMSPDAKAEREERERYAVAALAFCLKHDPRFLKHFWTKICRAPGESLHMPPIKADGILLEPPEWADLRLVSEHRNKRSVWVIEVKAGVRLDPKQRPDKP